MNIKQINWMNHLIELIVVVVGVTLAFLLNSWYNEYQEKQLEQRYLAGFLEDLQSDLVELDSLVSIEKQTLENLRIFLVSAQRSKLIEDSVLRTISMIAQFQNFNLKNITYESMKNTGQLNLIRNYELRKQLIEYYQHYDDKLLIEKVYYDYINTIIVPYIMREIDIVGQKFTRQNALTDFRLKNIVSGVFQLVTQNLQFHQSVHQDAVKLSGLLKGNIQS